MVGKSGDFSEAQSKIEEYEEDIRQVEVKVTKVEARLNALRGVGMDVSRWLEKPQGCRTTTSTSGLSGQQIVEWALNGIFSPTLCSICHIVSIFNFYISLSFLLSLLLPTSLPLPGALGHPLSGLLSGSRDLSASEEKLEGLEISPQRPHSEIYEDASSIRSGLSENNFCVAIGHYKVSEKVQ